MANEYLKRQPTSSGNSRRWTVSFWMKNSDPTQGYTAIMGAGKASPTNVYNEIFYNGSQTGLNLDKSSDPDNYNIIANPLLRDPSSWMHVVVSFTDQGDNANTRVKFYINGAFTDHNTGTNLDVSETSFFNDPEYIHYIGSRAQQSYGTNTFDAQYFDVFLVDGQALTPDVFGFYKEGKGYQSSGSSNSTDFGPGQWSPHSPRKIKTEIERKGGFGVNGFYLPMNDSSNFGADFHCTPNSIITLKGEDLPQPRNGLPTTSDDYVSQLREDPYAANLVLAVPGVNTQPTGSELVTNGTFDTDASGWTITDTGTLVIQSDGSVKVTRGTSARVAYQDITTVVGTTYELSVDITDIAGSHGQIYVYSTDHSGSIDTNIGYSFYTGTYKGTFTADTTTTRISLYAHPSGSTSYDNVSVKATTIPDYSADIKGSGTNKTLTVNGAAGIRNNDTSGSAVNGYYGNAMSFPNGGVTGGDDALRVTSSDFAFGTGDFTVEVWINPDSVYNYKTIFSTRPDNGSFTDGFNMWINSSGNTGVYSNAFLTQTSGGQIKINQWTHVVAERYNGQLTTYINGVAAAVQSSNTQNYTRTVASIGLLAAANQESFTGHMQDLRVYKGVAKYKGGFDVPKPYSPVGIESWRQVPDTCKNNFATLNAVDYNSSTTALSDGNLTMNATSNNGSVRSATYNVPNSGKYYFEFYEKVIDVTTTNYISIVSVKDNSKHQQYRGYGYIYTDGVQATGYATMAEGDLIGVGIDADLGKVSFYNNGTLVATVTSSSVDHVRGARINSYLPRGAGSYPPGDTRVYNFGQNPSFSGTIPAGTYTDSNGKGLFKYQPPTGFLALCDDNLPTPAIADPGEHFKTVLYTGSLTTGGGRLVSGVGFQPDLIWIKNRSRSGTSGDGNSDHALFDSVRGYDSWLASNTTNAENTSTPTNRLTGVHEDGFSVGYYYVTGYNGDDYVAWCWKAGGAAVSNSDGSITSQVSVNQTAGFSIVSYTGSSSAITVGHELGKKPNMILFKNRDQADKWAVYHSSVGATKFLSLNESTEATTSSSYFNDTEPTSSVFTVNQTGPVNQNNEKYIAYCWAEIEGFSKFGSYVGNGNADGPFVYCGFKPAWVMVKNIDDTGGRDWGIQDSSRASSNPCNKQLKANQSEVENSGLASSTFQIDMLSNGFKVINNTGIWNNDGETIIFMAFAESPFQTANAK